MIDVVIVHGANGSPSENWIPWLARNVEAMHHRALVPAFPVSEHQNLQAWRDAFALQIGELRRDVVLVGHSVGVAFILDLLERRTAPVRASFLASGFVGSLGLPTFDERNESFVVRDFDWERIRREAGRVFVYHSDDDPYVPMRKCVELCALLGASPRVIHRGGHLNAAAGFRTFPELWVDLRRSLREPKGTARA